MVVVAAGPPDGRQLGVSENPFTRLAALRPNRPDVGLLSTSPICIAQVNSAPSLARQSDAVSGPFSRLMATNRPAISARVIWSSGMLCSGRK